MNTKISLLVIDDDPNVCAAIKRGLERTHEFVVHTATSGAQGFALACALTPDILLIDMIMPPGITGAECVKLLREAPQTSRIPYIYLTGLMSKEDATVFGNVIDGEHYLAKPACIDEIVAMVRRVLAA